ncbi:MAG: thiosulfate sulfurtransferase [Gammaproteobacteria bacterium]|nr:thiosulfate sulfurtransferase [Gammaproteobacteria bacterium]NIM74709.1 thiosulfate sulfurtransferase [Gammaproteobacteria bacterium]NIN37528.1 thiosulfate sulfurtransferase [Gammaproteobacteria bacterium]NIO26542.1 thiosulfate sulfurtransferase [Gammaproteobacteria bacterium]NIO67094.1 thiosulfate sulfurtransferase [Gammaproteobacteria bacterium]
MKNATPDCPRVAAKELNELLQGDEEIALLDAREELSFGQAHILYASCMPLSRLELLADAMVPRRSARIVVCDGGEGLAERAAQRLSQLGYRNVAVLDGGVDAWREAGLEVFSGVNVPSKAFGEFIEVEYETPSVSADELKQMMDAGENMVVLDSRPMTEYHARNIPTGICVPGAELAYRVHDVAPSADTLVVVNCAGRTRSIIGAQSLINAGIENRVVALRNGTMGWHLAGHGLEHGMTREARDISEHGLAAARDAAARVAERFGVRRIDRATLNAWRAESTERSLYVFDVRHPYEYEAGHLPGSRSAPGGQLVQETDHFIATLRSRVVLVDDTGVRATMTASWLNQMGWPEVAVLDNALQGVELERGPEPVHVLGLDEARADAIEVADLDAALREGKASVVDLGLSRAYRAGHIPGAWFATRARLAGALAAVPRRGRLVLTSSDGVLARLAAAEAAALTDEPVQVLAGGTGAWIAAGMAVTSGAEHLADVADDVWLRPYEKDWGVEDSMREYLTWEVGLVEQLKRDGTARFRPCR